MNGGLYDSDDLVAEMLDNYRKSLNSRYKIGDKVSVCTSSVTEGDSTTVTLVQGVIDYVYGDGRYGFHMVIDESDIR